MVPAVYIKHHLQCLAHNSQSANASFCHHAHSNLKILRVRRENEKKKSQTAVHSKEDSAAWKFLSQSWSAEECLVSQEGVCFCFPHDTLSKRVGSKGSSCKSSGEFQSTAPGTFRSVMFPEEEILQGAFSWLPQQLTFLKICFHHIHTNKSLHWPQTFRMPLCNL